MAAVAAVAAVGHEQGKRAAERDTVKAKLQKTQRGLRSPARPPQWAV